MTAEPAAHPSRLALITGAGSGIGRFIARGLAQAGFDLLLAGRSAAKLSVTRDWIAGEFPRARIETRSVDLAELAQARAFAESLAGRPIDVLMHNAGTFTARRSLTAEGIETVLATNTLAPMVLTEALLPSLRAAVARRGEARVVVTGSSTSDHVGIDPDDLELERGWGMSRAYARSKLAVMIAAFHQARALAGTGITVNVVHPGFVATDLVRDPGHAGWGWRVVTRFALSPEEGADTPVWAATAPEMRGVSGCYLKRRTIVRPNRRAEDAALAGRVWSALAARVRD
jgi:NAD(P)-dependent dehydrogenase (short-subunit alcohol dehydrogenase family)